MLSSIGDRFTHAKNKLVENQGKKIAETRSAFNNAMGSPPPQQTPENNESKNDENIKKMFKTDNAEKYRYAYVNLPVNLNPAKYASAMLSGRYDMVSSKLEKANNALRLANSSAQLLQFTLNTQALNTAQSFIHTVGSSFPLVSLCLLPVTITINAYANAQKRAEASYICAACLGFCFNIQTTMMKANVFYQLSGQKYSHTIVNDKQVPTPIFALKETIELCVIRFLTFIVSTIDFNVLYGDENKLGPAFIAFLNGLLNRVSFTEPHYNTNDDGTFEYNNNGTKYDLKFSFKHCNVNGHCPENFNDKLMFILREQIRILVITYYLSWKNRISKDALNAIGSTLRASGKGALNLVGFALSPLTFLKDFATGPNNPKLEYKTTGGKSIKRKNIKRTTKRTRYVGGKPGPIEHNIFNKKDENGQTPLISLRNNLRRLINELGFEDTGLTKDFGFSNSINRWGGSFKDMIIGDPFQTYRIMLREWVIANGHFSVFTSEFNLQVIDFSKEYPSIYEQLTLLNYFNLCNSKDTTEFNANKDLILRNAKSSTFKEEPVSVLESTASTGSSLSSSETSDDEVALSVYHEQARNLLEHETVTNNDSAIYTQDALELAIQIVSNSGEGDK